MILWSYNIEFLLSMYLVRNRKEIVMTINEMFDKINNIEEKTKRLFLGQDDATTRKIIISITRAHYFDSIRSNFVLVGNKEDAKNIVKAVSEELQIPCIRLKYYNFDANVLIRLLQEAKGDINLAEKGIIIIENIDEITINSPEERTIMTFLESDIFFINPQIDNDYVEEDDEGKEEFDEVVKEVSTEEEMQLISFNTDNLIIIFSANFDEVKKTRDKRIKNIQYGFGPQFEQERDSFFKKEDFTNTSNAYKNLVEYFDNIIELENYTIKKLSDKIKYSDSSLFKKYEKAILEMGIEVIVEDSVFDSIVKSSLSLDEKGGETDRIINSLFQDIMYDIFLNPPGSLKKCFIYIYENVEIKHMLS